jgi:hypothetical protein
LLVISGRSSSSCIGLISISLLSTIPRLMDKQSRSINALRCFWDVQCRILQKIGNLGCHWLNYGIRLLTIQSTLWLWTKFGSMSIPLCWDISSYGWHHWAHGSTFDGTEAKIGISPE